MKFLSVLLLALVCHGASARLVDVELAVLEHTKARALAPATHDRELYEQLIIGIAERRLFVETLKNKRYILVNVSDQHIRVIDGDKLVVYEKVIVGKDTTPTPVFSEVMTEVIFNPVWNVPPDLVVGILEQMKQSGPWPGYRALTFDDVELDLNTVSLEDSFRLVQDAGEQNTLGRFKFNFLNEHGVYIHDTPSKHLFAQSNRKFSAGCIRMQHPERLVTYLLGDSVPETKITTAVSLTKPIQVFIVNWRVWFDDNGSIQYKP